MRMRFATLLFIALAAAAQAETVAPGEEGALKEILPPTPGEHICFARAYDAAHLKAHPKQTVSYIEFRLAYYRHDPDANFPEGQRDYYFDLRAKRKGSADMASTGGECNSREGTIFCGVDCDGGGVFLKKGDAGVTLSFGDMRGISMSSECGGGEEGGADLLPGQDDKEFKLTKIEACPGYESW
jgi:hypothetical protein